MCGCHALFALRHCIIVLFFIPGRIGLKQQVVPLSATSCVIVAIFCVSPVSFAATTFCATSWASAEDLWQSSGSLATGRTEANTQRISQNRQGRRTEYQPRPLVRCVLVKYADDSRSPKRSSSSSFWSMNIWLWASNLRSHPIWPLAITSCFPERHLS